MVSSLREDEWAGDKIVSDILDSDEGTGVGYGKCFEFTLDVNPSVGRQLLSAGLLCGLLFLG